MLASTVPTVEAYDPAFAYEMADDRPPRHPRRCWSTSDDVFYYLTLYNENYADAGRCPRASSEGIIRGLYRWARRRPRGPTQRATILFSGTAQGAARAAQAELAEH